MKKFQIKVFEPKRWQRILLYVAMTLFAALSLYQMATEHFGFAISIVFYACAGVTIFPGVFYLVRDVIKIRKRRVEIKEKISENRHVVKLKENPFLVKVQKNRYIRKIRENRRLRTILFAVPGTMSNVIFAIFNAFLGIYSRSAWFGSLAAYYILLSIMRGIVVDQERQLVSIKESNRRWGRECDVYRRSSVLLIIMAVVLAVMVILLEHSIGGKNYPGITIYVAAVFAFYKIIKSTINVIKVRKNNSPLLSALRRIGHVDACVSILTLQTALLATFGAGQEMLARIMNGATGTAVCLIVLFIGIDGFREAVKQKKTGGREE